MQLRNNWKTTCTLPYGHLNPGVLNFHLDKLPLKHCLFNCWTFFWKGDIRITFLFTIILDGLKIKFNQFLSVEIILMGDMGLVVSIEESQG